MIDIYMRPTEKGEVYWTYVGAGKNCVRLIAYRYTRGRVLTRYKIKHDGDKQAQTASVRKLLKEYPIAFSLLRDATGTRSYDI